MLYEPDLSETRNKLHAKDALMKGSMAKESMAKESAATGGLTTTDEDVKVKH